MYKAYRAALEALRREFQSGGSRYPGLFYEGLATPDAVMFSDDPWEPVWAAFVAANSTKDEKVWEEWHVPSTRNGCGRFYGDGGGVELFKRLAESLALVLCEMGEIREEDCNFFECLETMFAAAGDYPTPLFRTKDRTWGVENGLSLDTETLNALHEEMSESAEGELSYPVHPSCLCLVHDVFTSAAAFIDAILDPDSALLVGGGYTDKPPIYLKHPVADVRGTASNSLDQNEVTVEPLPADDSVVSQIAKLHNERYVFKSLGKVWLLRYPGDKDCFFADQAGVEDIPRLLMNPYRLMDALEVEGTADVPLGADEKLDPETIRQVEEHREEASRRLEYEKLHTGDQKKIDEFTNTIERDDEYLKNAKGAFRRIRLLGSPGETEKARKRVSSYLSRNRDAIADEMPLLGKHLKDFVTAVPGQSKWRYAPPELPHWVF